MDKHCVGRAGLSHAGSPSLTCMFSIHMRYGENKQVQVNKSEKSFFFVLMEQVRDSSITVLNTTTTVFGGLTECRVHRYFLVLSRSWKSSSAVGTVTVSILLMRNLKPSEVK